MTTKTRLCTMLAAVSAALLVGCGTYVPDGSTVVSVKGSKAEFDRADIRATGNELANRTPITMRWYDTNTFITSATLSPGVYSFRARNYDGAGLVRNITVESKKDYYEIQAAVKDGGAGDDVEDATAKEGPAVSGSAPAARNTNLSVLFIGRDVILRTVRTDGNGKFTVNAPDNGTWKVQIHQLGQPARSWIGENRPFDKPVDLGNIQLN